MKIRNGHVTNSSSSSYVILIKNDAYKKALESVDKLLKPIIESAFSTKDTAFGVECVKFEDMSSAGGHSTSDDLNDELRGIIGEDEEYFQALIPETYKWDVEDYFNLGETVGRFENDVEKLEPGSTYSTSNCDG